MSTKPNQISKSVVQELNCSNKELIKVAVSVAKYSPYNWMPVIDCGLGNLPTGKICWSGIARDDLAGASVAFMEYGLGLAVPGTNTAVAAGIAFNAAGS